MSRCYDAPVIAAAFLKPIIGPVVVFCGLLVVRWVAIVVMRLLPQSRVKATLFDRGLLDRKPWIVGAIGLATIAALFAYTESLGL